MNIYLIKGFLNNNESLNADGGNKTVNIKKEININEMSPLAALEKFKEENEQFSFLDQVETCYTEISGNKLAVYRSLDGLNELEIELIAHMTERAKLLINNSLDWCVVTKEVGEIELKHDSELSCILQCGEDPSEYGYESIEGCWNGEDLSTEDDWIVIK